MATSNTCPICGTALRRGTAVCPACGYHIIERTQEFEPIAVEKAAAKEPRASEALPVLRSVRGPKANTSLQLTANKMTIGRDPANDIFLNDTTVSRRHATIEKTASGYRITDEHSFNGVWVNNVSVSSQLLAFGDVIQMGSFCFVFEQGSISSSNSN